MRRPNPLAAPLGSCLAAALALAAAAPALALNCLPPDVARSFHALDAAPETYVIVHGRLVFDEARLPVGDMSGQSDSPAHTPIPGHLTGEALTKEGFTSPFDAPVTIDVRCFGPWCAAGESGMEILAFIEKRAEGYVLTLDPCYGNVFVDPPAAYLDQAASCLRGEACEARDY